MYGTGQGVPQEYVLAHMWFNTANTNGKEEAAQNRDAAEDPMTGEQITGA